MVGLKECQGIRTSGFLAIPEYFKMIVDFTQVLCRNCLTCLPYMFKSKGCAHSLCVALITITFSTKKIFHS